MNCFNAVGRVGKECVECGTRFSKQPRDDEKTWALRRFCSQPCANRANAKPAPISERFWKYVNKAESGCWEWRGTKDRLGYGRLSAGRGKSPLKAHRVSFEMANGSIPAGLFILHKCDNPSCVNPDHLEAGDQKKNIADMIRRGRRGSNRRLGPQQQPALTHEQAETIKRRRAAGEAYTSIGLSMGISPSTARLYALNKRSPK